jgi:hypothetical protein
MKHWLNDSYASGKWTPAIAGAKLSTIELDFGKLGKQAKCAFLVGTAPERYCALIGTFSSSGPLQYLSGHMLGYHTRSESDFTPSATVSPVRASVDAAAPGNNSGGTRARLRPQSGAACGGIAVKSALP